MKTVGIANENEKKLFVKQFSNSFIVNRYLSGKLERTFFLSDIPQTSDALHLENVLCYFNSIL